MSPRFISEYGIVFLAVLFLSVTVGGPGNSEAAEEANKHWFIPDHVKCQYAGNMGFLSLGCGYALFRDRMHTDLFYGYARERSSGASIHHLTLKNTFYPLTLRVNDRWRWATVTVGAHLLSKIGNDHSGTWFILPDRYPDQYYSPTAFHVLLTCGTQLEILSRNGWPRAGIYFESGTTALSLKDWMRESSLRLADIISFDLGVIKRF